MAPRSDSYQIDDFVANMLPLVAEMNIILLVAHSLGGPVSFGLHQCLRRKPRRSVLVDPAQEKNDRRSNIVRSFYLKDIKAHPSPSELPRGEPNWTENAAIVKSFALCLASEDAVLYITTNIRPWSFTRNLPPDSDGVEIVIIGAGPEHKTVFKPEEAEMLSRSRPDIRCMVASGSGRGIQREQPELIVRAALEPLDSL